MLDGSCACGRVRYEIRGELLGPITLCHCWRCRKHSGSSFGTTAPILASDLVVTSGDELLASWESSVGVHRVFASCCGSPLYKRNDATPDFYGLRLGTLDTDPGCTAEMHFMAGSRVPWLEIHDALPQNADAPPFGERDAEWRILEQRRALLGAIAAGDATAVADALATAPALARTRDAQGVSGICRAVYAGHDAIARRLAAGRDDLDIFEAAVLGDVRRVRELVAADLGRRDAYSPDGFHPLGYACFFGRRELFDLLLECGADVAAPARNAMQVQPLHSAAAHADPDLALYLTERLLAAGAPPNVAQQGGFTPLHEAALRGHGALVALLLQHGADADAHDTDGRTAVDLARGRGAADVLALLARTR